MKSLINSLLLLCSLVFLSGCVSNQKGAIIPGNDIGALRKYYVVHLPADTRGVNQMIADELNSRGFTATTGEAVNVPADVDAVITYQDKWMWDITMYMIQLDIQFRKPVSDVPMATGSSMRTSLARKSPPNMIKEVLDQIFDKAGVKSPAPMGSK
jgi:hypothetical protein